MENYKSNYKCPKCGHTYYETSDFRAVSGLIGRMMNFQSEKFTTVTCQLCKFTELYKSDERGLADLFDLMSG